MPGGGVIVVTACDAGHFPLAEELLESLRAIPDRGFRIGFVQVGDIAPPATLTDRADEVRIAASDEAALGEGEGFRISQLGIKANLPAFFPGHDVYIWLDGDTWVQNAAGIAHLAEGAYRADICLHPQLDPNYWRCRYPDAYTLRVYERIFGAAVRDDYAYFPMVNAGVFGALAGSPLWTRWSDLLADIRSQPCAEEKRFFSDQIPLHHLIFSGALTLHPLRAVDNWLVQHCTPGVDPATGRLTAPSFPYEEINIVHLVGAAKWRQYDFGNGRISLRYGDVRAHLLR